MKTVRIAFALFALVAGIASYVATVPDSKAISGLCTYYSTAKYKTVVGQQGTGCCGAVISWGQITPYRKCDTVYCLDVVCPN